MGHPGTFLLLACAASAVVWHLTGVWQRGSWSPIWRGALRQAWKSSPSVVLLASVAGVLVDSGMVRTVARGASAATGHAYPAIAPLVGALGSFITGSTTSSNALFSALQRDVALLIGDRPADLLAGQLAGGNIGNSLAPVVILLGLSASRRGPLRRWRAADDATSGGRPADFGGAHHLDPGRDSPLTRLEFLCVLSGNASSSNMRGSHADEV